MINRIIGLLFFSGLLLAGCSKTDKRYEKMVAKNDSLETIIKNDRVLAASLENIRNLIDSIVISEAVMAKNSESPDDAAKLREVAAYIQSCRSKISQLQAQVVQNQKANSAASVTIRSLEHTIQVREEELGMMEDVILFSFNENDNLIHVVNLQQSEIDDKLLRLQLRENEIQKLQEIDLYRPAVFGINFYKKDFVASSKGIKIPFKAAQD